MAELYVSPRIEAIAATAPDAQRAVSRLAERVLMAARAEAASHVLSGAYIAGLKIVTSDDFNGKDRFVIADDPGAAAIEWGHFPITRSRGGRRASAKAGLTRVPGQYVMGNAIKRVT